MKSGPIKNLYRFIVVQTTDISRILWLCMSILSIFSVYDIFTFYSLHDLPVWLTAGLFFFSVLKASVLTFGWQMTKRWKFVHFFFNVFLGIFAMLSIINFISSINYDTGISRRLFMVAAETSPEEIKEFIPGFLSGITGRIVSFRFLAFLIAFSILVFLINRIPAKLFRIAVWTTSILGISYFIIYSISFDFGRTNHIMTYRTWSCVRSVQKTLSEIRDFSAVERPLPEKESAKSLYNTDNLIIVIGESASKENHSVYGYPLPTTPHLDAMRDSLIIFQDVIGCSVQTAENLPRILTFKSDNPADDKDWYEYPTAIQLWKALGYKTYWLSNQEKFGTWSNASYAIVRFADKVIYAGSDFSEDHLLSSYDEVLLPYLDNALNDDAPHRAIYMHLMGSHHEYNLRYPASRNILSTTDVKRALKSPWLNESAAAKIAEYDNSIIYTDSILSTIIRKISTKSEPSVLVYFSDHGENVYSDSENKIGRDRKYVKIPFLIYANQAYRTKNPDYFKRLREGEIKPFSTSNLLHLLISLSGSTYSQYDESKDPSSPGYRSPTRFVDGENWTLIQNNSKND